MKKIIQISTMTDNDKVHERLLVIALTEDGKVFFRDINDNGHNWEDLDLECNSCRRDLPQEVIGLDDLNNYICNDCNMEIKESPKKKVKKK